MPRQVDHEQRRRQLADALWRVVADRGVDAVSLRTVAAAAGVSMGLVQHYFGTRDGMVAFAMDVVEERVLAECAGALASVEDPGPRDRVRAFLRLTIPTDDVRGRETRAMLTYVVSGHDDPLARRLRDGLVGLRAHVATEIATAGVAPDPEQAATTLLALADGLALHVLGAELDPQDALRVLDAGLDTAFGPAARPAGDRT